MAVYQIAGKRSRAQLGLRAPRSRSTNIRPQAGGSTLHYGGIGSHIPDHATCEGIWRGWQAYHMDVHGWADIAYTMGFCQHGYVLAGRGYGVRTAAQGTNRGNDISYAFCHVNEAGAAPTDQALTAAAWCVEDARRNGGAGMSVWPHHFWHPTDCPGEVLTNTARWLSNRALQYSQVLTQGDSTMPQPPTLQEIQQGVLYYPCTDVDGKSPINVKTEIDRTYAASRRHDAVLESIQHQLQELATAVAALTAR